MIVDFIEIKEKLFRATNLFLREQVKQKTPFLSLIGSRYMHEGNETTYETTDNETKKMEYKQAESIFQLSQEEMERITIPEIFKKIEEVAEDMASQMEGGAFKTLSDELDKVGNMIPGNPALSQEALLQGLELVNIDFDDSRDKPVMPTLFVHPDQFQKFQEQEAKMTEQEKQKFEQRKEEILNKKYDEYVKREGKRKLVD